MWTLVEKALEHNGLITAFALVGVVMWLSVLLSRHLTLGRIHGSAIAIVIGLVLAWIGGTLTGGQKGLADMALFSGIGLMGGAMLRDFAIVATAFEVQATEARKAGLIGAVSLLLGTVLPFTTEIYTLSLHDALPICDVAVGASMAWAFGYRDAVSMTTIGAGAVTYIVGPVTGAAIGASSDVMALSIATGLIKAIIVMVGTPVAARWMGSGRHGQWGDGRARGDGSATGALWCADRHVPYRSWLSARAVGAVLHRAWAGRLNRVQRRWLAYIRHSARSASRFGSRSLALRNTTPICCCRW